MTHQKTWEVIIADAPHRANLFAEIWFNSEHLAEIHIENGEPTIEIYPNQLTKFWTINYGDLLDALKDVDSFLDSLHQSK